MLADIVSPLRLLSLAALFALGCSPESAQPQPAPNQAAQNQAATLPDPDLARPMTAAAVSAAIEVLNPSDPSRPLYHTFGTVEFGEIYVRSVRLRNLESVPVTVLQAMGACSCGKVKRISTTDADGRVVQGKMGQRGNILTIPPGAEFQVDMVVDTNKVTPNQPKLAILRVKTDSQVQPFLTFEINFLPESLFEMAAPRISMGMIPIGGGTGETLQIFSRAALNQARLVEVIETSPGLEAELELISGYNNNWNLTVTSVGQSTKGYWRGHVLLSTTDRDGQGDAGRLKIPVDGRVVDPVVLLPESIGFGRVPPGEGRTVKAIAKGLASGHRIRVLDAQISGPSAPYLQVRLEPIAANTFGQAVQVEAFLELAENAPEGNLEAQLTLTLDGEYQEQLRASITGAVGAEPIR